MAERTVEREAFRRSFDDNAGLQAKTWIFTMIPLIAVVTAALYGFRRFFFEHLIFATHFLAFMLAWMLITVLLTWGFRLAGIRLSPQNWDSAAAGRRPSRARCSSSSRCGRCTKMART